MEQTAQITNILKSKNLINSMGIALAIVIAVGAGYYFGTFRQSQAIKTAEDQAVREIFAEALAVNSLSGKILSVASDKKSIVVQIPRVALTNLPENYQTKTLLIDSDTKITSSEQKSAVDFQKEIMEARIKLKGNPLNFVAPLPVTIHNLTVDDLKPDVQINFSFDVGSGKSILDSEFNAIQITILDLEK